MSRLETAVLSAACVATGSMAQAHAAPAGAASVAAPAGLLGRAARGACGLLGDGVRDRLASKLGAWRFRTMCRRIVDTPPLLTSQAPLLFVSMVSHKDVQSYLLAIKSIYRYVGEGRIIVINDGSLTGDDLALLRVHAGAPTVVGIGSIDTASCPRGGTWERLMLIAELARDSYVIQVDSDLLALSSLPEVIDAYRRNVAFTQSGDLSSALVSLEQAAARADTQAGEHMQTMAERALRAIHPSLGQRYARGSSGFAGFPRGADLRPVVEAFSAEMVRLVGLGKWSKWGSEQVASNYVIANCPDAVLLDAKRYSLHWEGRENEPASLIHFVGVFRYRFGTYLKHGKRVIAELKAPAKLPERVPAHQGASDLVTA